MKRIIYGALLCVFGAAAACSDYDDTSYDDELGRTQEALKYVNGGAGSLGPLTRKTLKTGTAQRANVV